MKSTVWLERAASYDSLALAIERPGSHVCLDGPTGVGKTSLVHTYIAQEAVRHCSVMVTQAMTWQDLCRKLLGTRTNRESTYGAEAEASLNNGLPTARLKVSLGTKRSLSDNVQYAERLAASWTEDDVARELAEQDLLVVFDDMERANDALMSRVSDLCKLLTQAYVSPNAKVVTVGSGNIFVRLHRANPALDERISQVSLGAFKAPSDARLFLQRGLDKLGLRHPWNSAIPKEFELRDKCRAAVWEAADGLPKSLNRLGYDIAVRGRGRKAISAHDVMDSCQKMSEEHWIQYSQEFPEVLDVIEKEPAVAELIRCMYEDGITRIHRIPKLISRACESRGDRPSIPAEGIERAISLLVATGFVVQTGKSAELLFVKHPAAAHTLGVVMRDPSRFAHIPVARRPKQAHLQLQFAFPLPSSFSELDDEHPSEDA